MEVGADAGVYQRPCAYTLRFLRNVKFKICSCDFLFAISAYHLMLLFQSPSINGRTTVPG